MSTRKRNEWLEDDASDAEDNDVGYNSEEEEKSRGSALAGRSSKRRKVQGDDSDPEYVGDIDEDAQEDIEDDGDSKHRSPGNEVELDEDEDDISHQPTLKPLTPKQLAASQKAARKTGVVYLSRIPPFMKPSTVKSLLQPYGAIGRIFLTPEDPAVYSKRKTSGGNKKRSFVDGWVEFLDKKKAKACVELLNAQIVGGKKGGYYHDDVWNMRYLKGFKWSHLTEQIANENAERASRMRAEIARTSKENKEFLRNVERAKILNGMQEKRGKQKKTSTPVADGPAGDEEKPRRQFWQNEVKSKKAKESAPEKPSEDVQRVLSKIF
ncbi:RNA recognition domain-containing protein [Saccharata proteae CBS 121410]|uniref:18S rRNA factor 2 n=1 Tax=Saccharata proteae CBS 121410 TaxID=1314787 RepID=A0A9P4M2R6_9PEZI|nr:RNA recognition domain-containing protein [Saccharata proteae CBS 121410]